MKKFIERFLKWLIYKKWKKKVKNIYKKTEMEIKDSKFQKVKEKYPKKWNIWFHFPEKILEKNREYDSFSKELENAQKITKEERKFLIEKTNQIFKEKWGNIFYCKTCLHKYEGPLKKDESFDENQLKKLHECKKCDGKYCEEHKVHSFGHQTLNFHKQKIIGRL